ncbi:MAG: hypothetical protein PHY30_02940 [Candidatus Pacebacteria bacterium]|nr:hypothetical protein [Candidatus Paceibacterota bacterium]
MKMIAKIKIFVKEYEKEIVLFIAVFLISSLSFALGYLSAKERIKEPIKVEKINYEIKTPRINS